MKNSITLILLLLFVTTSYSQAKQATKKLVTKQSKNFLWNEKEQSKNYDIVFTYLLPDDIVIPEDRLQTIVINAMVMSKYKLKNKLNFKPFEVGLFKLENTLVILVYYSGDNNNGLDEVFATSFSFENENDLNFTEIKTEISKKKR